MLLLISSMYLKQLLGFVLLIQLIKFCSFISYCFCTKNMHVKWTLQELNDTIVIYLQILRLISDDIYSMVK